jgi:hypothetical protein
MTNPVALIGRAKIINGSVRGLKRHYDDPTAYQAIARCKNPEPERRKLPGDLVHVLRKPVTTETIRVWRCEDDGKRY